MRAPGGRVAIPLAQSVVEVRTRRSALWLRARCSERIVLVLLDKRTQFGDKLGEGAGRILIHTRSIDFMLQHGQPSALLCTGRHVLLLGGGVPSLGHEQRFVGPIFEAVPGRHLQPE